MAGGGWYGGGSLTNAASGTPAPAAGRSGWVYTQANYNTWKSGNSTDANKYKLDSNYYLTDASTIAGNSSFPSTSSGNETGHSGNGYARITNMN